MLKNVKEQKKVEFVVDWNPNDYYAAYKNKDLKKNNLSKSMEEALLNDGGYVSSSPVNKWKKSLLDDPFKINVYKNEFFSKNNIVISDQDYNISSGNHVLVTGFDIGKTIIRNKENKRNKGDVVPIKDEFKDKIVNKDNEEKVFISPDNLKEFNLIQSVQISENQFSVMEYDNVNIFNIILSEWEHIREMLTFLPLIIGGIIYIIYILKRLFFNCNYIFLYYVIFMNIRKQIYNKYSDIIKNKKLYIISGPNLPVSLSDSQSNRDEADNYYNNIVKPKVEKIFNDIQDIMDGVLLRKGHLDAKDVDGFNKVFREKMVKADIDPKQYFVNITVSKDTKSLSEEDKIRLSQRLFKKTDEMLHRIIDIYGNTPKTLEEHKKILDFANQRLKDLNIDQKIILNYSSRSNIGSDVNINLDLNDTNNRNNNGNNNITSNNNNQSSNVSEETINNISLQNDKCFRFNEDNIYLVELLEKNQYFFSYILYCSVSLIIILYFLKKLN